MDELRLALLDKWDKSPQRILVSMSRRLAAVIRNSGGGIKYEIALAWPNAYSELHAQNQYDWSQLETDPLEGCLWCKWKWQCPLSPSATSWERVPVISYHIDTAHLNFKTWQNLGCNNFLSKSDVIMGTMSSQITNLNIVYSTVNSGVRQTKQQSSASLAFVQGIHRVRWIPGTSGQ